MPRPPRVSIAMPVYNGEAFLEAAIDSVLGQTFEDIELLISDNGSTDASTAIIRNAARADGRVRFALHPVNRGAAWNYNHAMSMADPGSPYVKWAAADDLLAPHYLETVLAPLEDDPTVALTHTQTADIDEEGFTVKTYHRRFDELASPIPAERLRALVTLEHECFHVFGVLRHGVMQATRGHGAYPGADDVWLVEVALRGRIVQHRDVLFFRRQHRRRSMIEFQTQRDRAAWFDPTLDGTLSFPTWRIAGETIKAVRDAPMSAHERRDCYLAMKTLVAHNWENMLKNVARSAAELPGAVFTTRGGLARTTHRELPRSYRVGDRKDVAS